MLAKIASVTKTHRQPHPRDARLLHLDNGAGRNGAAAAKGSVSAPMSTVELRLVLSLLSTTCACSSILLLLL